MAAKLTLTVSQLNEYIRRMMQLDPVLHGVELKGEISNLKFHQTGTIFFTLKDEQSAIACVMYAGDAAKMQAHIGSAVDSPLMVHAQLGHPSLTNLKLLVPSFSKLSSLPCESC